MNHWKGNAEHAVIVCPFYQYPSTCSQIYSQVLDTGVALSSFEHLLFCFRSGIKETKDVSLRELFSYPVELSARVAHSERKQARHVMNALDTTVAKVCKVPVKAVVESRNFLAKTVLSPRAEEEVAFWQTEIQKIEKLTREEALESLIESRKIHGKIESIKEFIILST